MGCGTSSPICERRRGCRRWPDAARVAGADGLLSKASLGEELLVRSNRALRDAALEVFDHTFEVTSVLILIAILGAVALARKEM